MERKITMTTKLFIESMESSDSTLRMVKSAIFAEITKLELAFELALQRLSPFEKKYNVSSDYFIDYMAAEDLEGGDDEYVSWAGEYRLKQRLERKLSVLKGIEYEN